MNSLGNFTRHLIGCIINSSHLTNSKCLFPSPSAWASAPVSSLENWPKAGRSRFQLVFPFSQRWHECAVCYTTPVNSCFVYFIKFYFLILQERKSNKLLYCGPWRRYWQPIPVILRGESHGQRNLAGCSSCGCKELDMTERLIDTYTHLHYTALCLGPLTFMLSRLIICVILW